MIYRVTMFCQIICPDAPHLLLDGIVISRPFWGIAFGVA